jgi:glycogen operon protein
MLLAGDELGRTQHGNNNAYCQDNEINWLDWSDARDTEFSEFVRGLIAIRASRPLLHADKFRHSTPVGETGVRNVVWHRADGGEMTSGDWRNDEDGRLMLILNGLGQKSLLIAFNPGAETAAFTLPERDAGAQWQLLIDSGRALIEPGGAPIESGRALSVGERTVCLLETRDALA